MSRIRAILESRAFVPSCLLAALALRILCVAWFRVSPISDFQFYYDRAVDMAAGRGVVFHGAPTAYWPMGYSFLLAAIFSVTGPSVTAAVTVNVALSLASLWLVHRIALRLTASRLAASVALAIAAFHPNQIAYCALTANETLASFLVLAGTALLLRAREMPGGARAAVLACGGVVFGLGCLVKPQIAVLPTVCLAWFAWRDRQPRLRLVGSLVLVNAGLALTILPWTVRNYRVFGHVVFIANTGGVNLLIGNSPTATGAYPDPEAERRFGALLHSFGGDEASIDRAAGHEASSYIERHPLHTLALVPVKIWHLYAKDFEGFSWIGEASSAARARSLAPLKILAQLYYVGLIALVGAGLLWPRRARPDPLPLVIAVTFTAVYAVYFGMGRFHFVVMPWFALYAGGFISAWATSRSAVPSEAVALVSSGTSIETSLSRS